MFVNKYVKLVAAAFVLASGLAVTASAFAAGTDGGNSKHDTESGTTANGSGDNNGSENNSVLGDSTTTHFQLTSFNSITPKTSYEAGHQINLAITVKQTTDDNQGGETHKHGLPSSLVFDWTSLGKVTGKLIGKQKATLGKDKIGTKFTGDYQLVVPAGFESANGTQISTTGFLMTDNHGSSDSDDPVKNMLNIAVGNSQAGDLPEVPYAAALPAALAFGGLAVYGVIKRKSSYGN